MKSTRLLRIVPTFLLTTLIASTLLGSGLERVAPETVGMSSDRLERLDAVLEDYVQSGKLPGAVVLVARHGKIAHLSAFGMRDIEAADPMTDDDIFRIASQTKALVSTGVMMLQEEGKLLINDTLDKYLPEFAETTVAVANDDGGYTIVPANRKITLVDLLRHTSGYDYGNGPGHEKWEEAGIQGWYFADRDEPIRETVRRMASLPAVAQPGEKFVYGYSVDILGAVIEVVSGQALDTFLHERIFDPLGMVDTDFYLPKEKRDRFSVVYAKRGDNPLVRSPEAGGMGGQGQYVDGPRKSFSGGAGLLSTARDYAIFLQMMANGGEYDGHRILSRKTVELMTVNHLPEGVKFPWSNGVGFGLGFSVTLDIGSSGVPTSVGQFGWGGAYHSSYWVDPSEDLLLVYFTQVLPADGLDDHDKIRALVYQAVVD